MIQRRLGLAACVLLLSAAPAFAQNFDLDARRIAMGATGTGDNPAQGQVGHDPAYHAIVLPFGLFQVWKNKNIFDPGSDDFNPVLAMEYAAAPLHFMFNRNDGDTSGPFVHAITKGVATRDLNTYRGFLLAQSIDGAGVLAPHWGGTIKGKTARNGGFQGVFLGAGPYISLDTAFTTDQRLVDLLASTTPVYLPNATLAVADLTTNQIAGAVTVGYRARIPLATSSKGNRDGVYVAANYNYLRGFRYDHYSASVRLDTDAAGLITVLPTTTPIVAEHTSATDGRGYAIDLGVSVVARGWEFGLGASGIANRIDWSDFTTDTYTLKSVVSGGNFVHTTAIPLVQEQEVTLPVRTTGDLGYSGRHAAVQMELSHGLRGTGFNGGLEYRMKAIALRGGGRYIENGWHATGGVGFNFSPKVGLDVGAYGTSANIEEHEKLAIAVSLRINTVRKQ